MKKITKGDEPTLLQQYRHQNPDDDWKKGFKGNAGKEANAQVKSALIADQKGLCAYCEIDLKSGEGIGLDDFRVEHFLPENPKVAQSLRHNVALDWRNLFACCSGGNARFVVEHKSRFTSPDHSCDVPKDNFDWADSILNPLTDIPSFPRIFAYEETSGKIIVDSDYCPDALRQKAQGSIDKLRLNAKRLLRLRAAVIDTLREQWAHYSETMDEAVALEELAIDYFNNPAVEHYPAFFSLIRWYLADAAEAQLTTIAFDG